MTLHAKSAGTGEPLVMLHGLFGSLENLGALARPLAEAFQVHSLDLPNHGRSAWTESMSLSGMAAQLLRWLDDQGLEQVHLLGHSLGGKLAMELALTHPDRVKRLVVIDIAPVHYEAHHNDVFAGLASLEPAQLGSRAEADRQLQAAVPEVAVRSFLLKNLVRRSDSGFAWRMNLDAIKQHYPELIAANREGQFPGQTLFIKGGGSGYIEEQHRESILSRFPNTELRVVPGAGHWVHAEKPDLVARLVQRFLANGDD